MISGRTPSSSDEIPRKVFRHEGMGFGDVLNDTKANEKRDVPTLFIRSSQIHSRGDLVNGFLAENREKLGIQDWFNDEGRLQADAPVECVFVKTSRKPYILLEFSHDTVSAVAATEKLKALDKTIYRDQPVTVTLATDGLTVAEERKKLELRDAAKRQIVPGKEIRSDGAASKPSTTTTFVPRVLRKR